MPPKKMNLCLPRQDLLNVSGDIKGKQPNSSALPKEKKKKQPNSSDSSGSPNDIYIKQHARIFDFFKRDQSLIRMKSKQKEQ